LTAVRDRLARTEAEVAHSAMAQAQAQQAATTAQAEVARLQAEISRVAAKAQARERRATEADGERNRTVSILNDRDVRIAELAQALEQTRGAASEAQALAGTAQAELARLKTLHAGAVQARDQAATELAAKLASEATASAERDTAKAALVTAYAERDRLQAQVERQRADLEAQGGLQRQREEDFSGKLADAARTAGELKNATDLLKAENDRLRAEVERSDSRSATDIKKAERRATETQKAVEKLQQQVDEAKERISSLCGELSESKALQQNFLERAETEALMAEGNAKRWAQEREELIGLVKQAKLAVQNAKIARESDLSRIGELEGQLAVLAMLRPS
jgi:chromosome segregation ATPase